MTQEKIRVGVFGVGHLGKIHASLFKQITEANLVGVHDLDATKCEAVAAELGCEAFHDPIQLMKKVDALDIVVTTSAHYQIAEMALQNNLHLFIEKPITRTVEEAQKIITLSQTKKRTVQVGHIERFNAAVLALKNISLRPMFIESHRLAQFNPRGADVAVVLDLMIHDIDLILYLVGSPIKKIDASGVAVISDSVDITNARIRFENGCVANLTASRISQRKMRKMRLFQPDTYISIDLLEGLTEMYHLEDLHQDTKNTGTQITLGMIEKSANPKKILYEQLEAPEGNPLKMELESFLMAVRNQTQPPVTAEDGKRALEVALKIIEKIDHPEGD